MSVYRVKDEAAAALLQKQIKDKVSGARLDVHRLTKPKGAGSNPVRHATTLVAQMDEHRVSAPADAGSIPVGGAIHAAIAQLDEQGASISQDAGSSPASRAKIVRRKVAAKGKPSAVLEHAQNGAAAPVNGPLSSDQCRSVTLTLPWPPTANTNVRHGGGRHYLTKAHAEFRAAVAAIVMTDVVGRHVMHPFWPIPNELRGKLHVTILCYPPDRRNRDIDNLIKPILDALQHAGLYANDSAIDDIWISRRPVEGKPGCVIVEVRVVA